MTSKRLTLPTRISTPWHQRKTPGTALRAALALTTTGIMLARLLPRQVNPITSTPTGVVPAAVTAVEPEVTNVQVTAGFGLLFLVALQGWEIYAAVRDDKDKTRSDGPSNLIACLEVARQIVLKAAGNPDAILRLTVHRRIAKEHRVEQLVDYVGWVGRSTGGRRFSDRSGVVGRAVTSGRLVTMDRPAGTRLEDYLAELQGAWGMPATEARELTGRDQFSFVAVPINDGTDVIGVLYADCSVPGFFEREDTRSIMVSACEGVVRYLEVR